VGGAGFQDRTGRVQGDRLEQAGVQELALLVRHAWIAWWLGRRKPTKMGLELLDHGRQHRVAAEEVVPGLQPAVWWQDLQDRIGGSGPARRCGLWRSVRSRR
jgi:hypothetical protein